MASAGGLTGGMLVLPRTPLSPGKLRYLETGTSGGHTSGIGERERVAHSPVTKRGTSLVSGGTGRDSMRLPDPSASCESAAMPAMKATVSTEPTLSTWMRRFTLILRIPGDEKSATAAAGAPGWRRPQTDRLAESYRPSKRGVGIVSLRCRGYPRMQVYAAYMRVGFSHRSLMSNPTRCSIGSMSQE